MAVDLEPQATRGAVLSELHTVIETAGGLFRSLLETATGPDGLKRDAYVRYLQMQYHLTKEVQRYFLSAAANPRLAGKRAFREFLCNFAFEEEPHYGIAERDLAALGSDIGEPCLDVKLWHAYFSSIIRDRPYIRLGAASVLETIGTLASDTIKRLLRNATYLNESNTRFVVIHMHESLPHGTQFLLELTNSHPSPPDVADLVLGAREGALLYLRMASWALGGDPLQRGLC